jgi:hypothetical protein
VNALQLANSSMFSQVKVILKVLPHQVIAGVSSMLREQPYYTRKVTRKPGVVTCEKLCRII